MKVKFLASNLMILGIFSLYCSGEVDYVKIGLHNPVAIALWERELAELRASFELVKIEDRMWGNAQKPCLSERIHLTRIADEQYFRLMRSFRMSTRILELEKRLAACGR
jgi:hypothetical protein